MGNQSSKSEAQTPLRCFICNLATLDVVEELCKWKLVRLCCQTWPQYPLDNQSHWPPEGTFDFSLPTDLTNFCYRTGEWSEVPYVQAFGTLRSRPDLCVKCSTTQVLLARSPVKDCQPLALPSPSSFPDLPEDLRLPPLLAHNPPPPFSPPSSVSSLSSPASLPSFRSFVPRHTAFLLLSSSGVCASPSSSSPSAFTALFPDRSRLLPPAGSRSHGQDSSQHRPASFLSRSYPPPHTHRSPFVSSSSGVAASLSFSPSCSHPATILCAHATLSTRLD